MSETQKVELKEEDRKLLRSNIDAMAKAAKVSLDHEHKPDEAKHEHFAVNLEYMEKADACPDCVKGLDKFGKEYMKKTLEERSKFPYICDDCGLGVNPEKEDECPNCGGRSADKR